MGRRGAESYNVSVLVSKKLENLQANGKEPRKEESLRYSLKRQGLKRKRRKLGHHSLRTTFLKHRYAVVTGQHLLLIVCK